MSYWFGFLLNELPFVAFYWLLVSTLIAVGQGDIDSPVGWLAFGVAVVTTGGLAVVVVRGLRARPVLDRALSEGLGAGWRAAIDDALAVRLRRRRSPGGASCSRRTSCAAAMSSAWRTSATATRGN